MNYTIRPANLKDAEALFHLAVQLSVSFQVERIAFDRSLPALIADESARLLVAEQNHALVGYCLGFDHYTLYANGRVAWVEEIIVAPETRRKGMGRALMQSFEAWAKARDTKLVALATRRAASFYLSMGYEESATYFRKLL